MKTYLKFINEMVIYDQPNTWLDLYVIYSKFLNDKKLNIVHIKPNDYVWNILTLITNDKKNSKDGDIVLVNFNKSLEFHMVRLYQRKYDIENHVGNYYSDDDIRLENLGITKDDIFYDIKSADLVVNIDKFFYNIENNLQHLINIGELNKIIVAYQNGAKLPEKILDQLKDIIKQSEWN